METYTFDVKDFFETRKVNSFCTNLTKDLVKKSLIQNETKKSSFKKIKNSEFKIQMLIKIFAKIFHCEFVN